MKYVERRYIKNNLISYVSNDCEKDVWRHLVYETAYGRYPGFYMFYSFIGEKEEE